MKDGTSFENFSDEEKGAYWALRAAVAEGTDTFAHHFHARSMKALSTQDALALYHALTEAGTCLVEWVDDLEGRLRAEGKLPPLPAQEPANDPEPAPAAEPVPA